MDSGKYVPERHYVYLPVLQRASDVLPREQQQEPETERHGEAVPVRVLPVVSGKGKAVQSEHIAGVMFDERKVGEVIWTFKSVNVIEIIFALSVITKIVGTQEN